MGGSFNGNSPTRQQAAPPATGADDQIAQSEKLGSLKAAGVLTHDDCRKLKKWVYMPVVREGGVEPPHPFEYTDLNRARLPIPPLARDAGKGYRHAYRSRHGGSDLYR